MIKSCVTVTIASVTIIIFLEIRNRACTIIMMLNKVVKSCFYNIFQHITVSNDSLIPEFHREIIKKKLINQQFTALPRFTY